MIKFDFRRSPEEVWAKVMSKYFEHVSLQRKRYLLVCKNDRLMHTILMLTDERCPLCAMSPIVGGTLLGALLQLITVADESYFAIVLRSIVAIFRYVSHLLLSLNDGMDVAVLACTCWPVR